MVYSYYPVTRYSYIHKIQLFYYLAKSDCINTRELTFSNFITNFIGDGVMQRFVDSHGVWSKLESVYGWMEDMSNTFQSFTKKMSSIGA